MYLYQQACLAAVSGATRWLLLLAGAGGLAGLPVEAGQAQPDRRLQQRIDDANRRDAGVLVEIVDRAVDGRGAPAGLVLGWRHDFLKAQPGTFVPFVLTVAPAAPPGLSGQALLYVRAVRREAAGQPGASERGRGRPRYAFDAVFPVELVAALGEPARVTRGFAVPAGEYDVFVAVREQPADPLAASPQEGLRAGLIRQVLQVPDFWAGEFTTSTVMLAHRIRQLNRTLSSDEALERPYVIGLNDVDVATGSTFRRDGELIVVFVIYDAARTENGDFDVRVDYHVYRQGAPAHGAPPAGTPPPREGEQYVTRTNPQRFNGRALGRSPEGRTEYPVMAGQGILLSSFDAGTYRLGITVTDLLSGKTLTRDVIFAVAAADGEASPSRRTQ